MSTKTIIFFAIVIVIAINFSAVKRFVVHLYGGDKIDNVSIVSGKLSVVKPGMTRTEVKAIMGEPENILYNELKSNQEEIWSFAHSDFTIETPRVIFDKNSGKVIEIKK